MNWWKFAACPICKTLVPRRGILCEVCRPQLWLLREPIVREEQGFLIRSLFSWREDGPAVFDRLLRSLKGQSHQAYWSEFGVWMANSFAQRPGPLRALVPVPSQRPHALGFARGIQLWTDWRLSPNALLLPEGRRWQKGLSREQRQAVQFKSGAGLCTDYKAVLIIDDVVTTGATLRAAYHALGRPSNCEAWCLMDRRPCGS